MDLPRIDDIRIARRRIEPAAWMTPVLPLPLHQGAAPDLLLKCENLQRTGSFKIRGAYNFIASLDDAARSRGVIAYSSGNHAQGVACAAALLGVHAGVVMPENAVPAKVEGTRRFGAEVIVAGTDSETRKRVAEALAIERGLTLVPPYNHPAIIAGQGTMALEILEAVPDVATVLVPIGGGGLIAGIAVAIKALAPGVRVIGVEPEGAADASASRRAGRIVALPRVDTVADGLRALRVGDLPFVAISTLVDDVLTVPDAAVLDAARLLLRTAHLVAEPSGAVAVAAALAGAVQGRTVAIISGGNIDGALLRTLAGDDLPAQAHRL